ncbi:aspartate/glutamate racemase family protein [Nonomuraea sp. MG754425]|uniref:aspartate/glutamate racemase family protein n=1 Tax=Nonomuraea sp. MG754425 TaxID=2570319 RepID=UPI001F1FC22F|nr:aspartate/glutamate racemase family protein [Nonomuraea sp. MG754425]MCF6472776.1 aspartate/glutamate racemase family protein [Nonomuraea sp. MG754425]
MKLIGMIGGMSWESTALYYQLVNQLVRDREGGLHSARCIVYSVDFAVIEQMQVQGRWDEAGVILADAAKALEGAGADFVMLCTNTMHKVAAQVQESISIPFLHLADTTANAALSAGTDVLGFLGTDFSMSDTFYRDKLTERGLKVIVPDEPERKLVHNIIYSELCVGIIREESREVYRRIIRNLVAEGAQGIILGCTEIELLVGQEDSPVPVFPTTRLHCEAAVDHALDDALVAR